MERRKYGSAARSSASATFDRTQCRTENRFPLFLALLCLANIDEGLRPRDGEQPAHGGEGDRDAAFGRREARPGEMQEDGAPGAAHRPFQIVVEDHDEVVDMVVPPHLLM